jgi:hypothetical protein
VLNLGPLNLNDTELVFLGFGTTNLNGMVSGNASMDVCGGEVDANVGIPHDIDICDKGTLRGCSAGGGCGDIEVGGDFHPCSGTTPCTATVATLTCEAGEVELDCGASNTPCTTIQAAGAIDTRCDDVIVHLQAQPNIGTVFSNVITGSSNTCKPENVHATPSNVFVTAQCTANALSLVVQAVDGIFRNSF